MSSPRVVVVGAGIVGCSVAAELTSRGWTDVVVLDQGPLPLTGGSTSHAPGLVFATNTSRTMSLLARTTVQVLSGLEHEGGSCFLPVGGLEVATTGERVDELHRRQGLATSWGIRAEVVGPERCLELHPLLDGRRVLAGLHTPDDGLAKAVRACQALAARATAAGARFLGGRRVTGIESSGGRVTGVATDDGVVPADVVVSCAGFWGAALGEVLGLDVPLLPLAHQYARTTPLDLPAARAGAEAVLPILRHQDQSLYYREHGDVLGIGSYHHRPMPVDVSGLPGSEHVTAESMPSSMAFTPADFDDAWRLSAELLPVLGGARLDHGFNGIFSFTPDGGPLVGPSRDLDGLWVAEAVWVTHSAGVARAVAQWMVDGRSEVELHGADLHRFEAVDLDPATVAATSAQSFREVYDIIHPLQARSAPRDLRVSPFHPRQVELGAVFTEGSGWERPLWYEGNTAAAEELPEAGRAPKREPWASRFWSPTAAVEAWATRERVAMYDMTPLRRVEVSGPGALALLERATTRPMDVPVGRVTYALMLDVGGGVRSDVTVARLGVDRFQLGVNSPIDEDHLLRLAAQGAEHAAVRDVTGGTCCIGLWGPLARDVLAPLTADDVSHTGLGYFRSAAIRVAGVPVTALRVSYVGELGWELYTGADTGLRLWDALWESGSAHGVVAAGRSAFASLRLEKGYRAWGSDMTTEHDPFEAGLGFAVSPKKTGYLGHEAVAAASREPARRLTCLTLDEPSHVVMGHEPVLVDGAPAGYVTSAAYGYTIGRTVAYAWLPSSLAPGDAVDVQYFGERLPATVATEPLVDPDMTRLKR